MKIATLRLQNFKSFADSGELRLGQVNVLVGRNNTGKSTVIRGISLVQGGFPQPGSTDVRVGEERLKVQVRFTAVNTRNFPQLASKPEVIGQDASLYLEYPTQHSGGLLEIGGERLHVNFGPIPNSEPHNLMYSYLSKRKVAAFDRQVNLGKSRVVEVDLRHLVSKIDVLANPDHPAFQEYTELCNALLGFRVTAVAAPDGKQAGIPVGKHDRIYIEEMGEGVSSLLGLITSLCMAEEHVFLLEEPENDIHPEGLKLLLDAIVEKSASNQFIISTHSNIVTKYLGAAAGSKMFEITMDYQSGQVPTSTVREIEPTPEARIAVLRQLGYELYDFDLWDGWLILEEASAEVIIRDYLIPWFVPSLSRIRTVAAGGTSKVGPTFEDFRRLFLFTHLEPQYRERAWVVVDGDDTGRQVVVKLRDKYRTWPAAHFKTLKEQDFEHYYPDRFADEVKIALAKSHDAKPGAKRELLDRVKHWCDASPDEAKQEFEVSAAEVVAVLREIERGLCGGEE